MATTVRSSVSQTIISLLGTVGSTAGALAQTIDSAASSVDMLDRYVQRAKTRQVEAHAIEDRNWRTNMILNAGREQEKILTAVQKEYSDPARAQRFNAVVADLEALFAAPAE